MASRSDIARPRSDPCWGRWQADEQRPNPRHLIVRQALSTVARWLAALLGFGLTFWWGLGLAVAGPGSTTVRGMLAMIYAGAGLAAIVCVLRRRGRRPALAAFGLALFAVLAWWASLRPSNDRPWTPELARLAHATVEGDLVTVHDIRNFDYRTETDFTPAYYDHIFDLRTLDSIDLLAVYWIGPA